MKSLYFLFFLLLFSTNVSAHEYFFGFAELTYDSAEAKYEGTLILSTHDLEEWLKKRGVQVTELEFHQFDEDLFQQMEEELFKGFQLFANGRQLKLQGIGFETIDAGTTQIYFHSEEVALSDQILITFDLLMDTFPNQQNKITFRNAKYSTTAIFLSKKPTTSILTK